MADIKVYKNEEIMDVPAGQTEVMEGQTSKGTVGGIKIYQNEVSENVSAVNPEVFLEPNTNEVGDFIKEVTNNNLNTSNRNILKDFTFSPDDYQGAFKSGDIEWNIETGAVTGGSGTIMYRGGIVGANAGSETFSLDSTTGLLVASGAIINNTELLFNDIYGDGSDGDATISSNTNLSRDMYYEDLTISGASVWLNPNGYRIFVNGTLTINATCRIQRDGNAGGNGNNGGGGGSPGTGGTAGAALAAGSVPGAVAGIVGQTGGTGGSGAGGGNGTAGAAGNNAAKSTGSAGVNGGAGGDGGDSGAAPGGGTGGAAGTGGTQTGTVYNSIKNYSAAYLFSDTQSSTLTNLTGSAGSGGSGSGAGGGASVGTGGGGGGSGGGGSAGGIIIVFARIIVLTGDITAYGGSGGDGGDGAAGVGASAGGGGGGAGGAGGSGGVCIVVYNNKSGAGTIVSPGQSGGAAGSGGAGDGTGLAGDNGDAGPTGSSGTAITLQV